MSFLLPFLIWFFVAFFVSLVVIGACAILNHRAQRAAKTDGPIGVHNLPIPANDRGPAKKRGRLLSSVVGAGAAVLALHTAPIEAQPVVLPPLHVTAPDPSSCVDVQVEGARSLSFDCLNQQLKADAQSQAGTSPDITAKDVTGTGAPTTVGTFSYTGTSIRMGDAFGKSAIPQRPPAPSFTNALIPSGAR